MLRSVPSGRELGVGPRVTGEKLCSRFILRAEMKGSYCRGEGAFNTGRELRSKQRYVLPKTDEVNGPLHIEYCLGLTSPTHFSKKKNPPADFSVISLLLSISQIDW